MNRLLTLKTATDESLKIPIIKICILPVEKL